MQPGPQIKTLVVIALVVAAVAYGLIVEFAVNAGRVHRGVSVQGFDIGGLNPAEAEEALKERGDEMKLAPMIFTTEGFDCRFTPGQVGWGPQAFDTAAAAMDIGRKGSVADVLGERWRAWTQGVTIRWAGRQDPVRVKRELDRCEELGAALGLEIDRARLRYKIKRAIVTWPRRPFAIPLQG